MTAQPTSSSATNRRTALLIANGFALAEAWRTLTTNAGAQHQLFAPIVGLAWLAGFGIFFGYLSLYYQDPRPKRAGWTELVSAIAFLVFCAVGLIHVTAFSNSSLRVGGT
jgi:hypothetical protein